jgi:hypothetical protein
MLAVAVSGADILAKILSGCQSASKSRSAFIFFAKVDTDTNVEAHQGKGIYGWTRLRQPVRVSGMTPLNGQ